MKTSKAVVFLNAALGVAVSLVAVVTAAEAAVINFTSVRSGFNNFEALAVDPGTGQVYERTGYNGESTVRVYANISTFAANTPSATLTLSPGAGFFGTYIAVNQGQLYGRTNFSNSAAATWDTNTGVKSSAISGYTGMGGGNGADTFDWGGHSGVNFMQDSTGRYVVGGVASNHNWQIERLGVGLNSVSSTVYTPIGDLSLGWGFIINGTLFTGANYNSNLVTNAVNVNTGAVSSVSDTLSGLGTSYYLSGFSYDYASDTLYAYNRINNTVYQAADASGQFGVVQVGIPSAVPEPGSVALFGLGLAGLGFSRRRKEQSR